LKKNSNYRLHAAQVGERHIPISAKMKPASRTNEGALKAGPIGPVILTTFRPNCPAIANAAARSENPRSRKMSTYTASRFDEMQPKANRTGWFRQESAFAFGSAAATLWAFCSGLYDGLAAYWQYEQLRSEGVAHDTALRKALLHRPLIPDQE
jgi:hypothetical protein